MTGIPHDFKKKLLACERSICLASLFTFTSRLYIYITWAVQRKYLSSYLWYFYCFFFMQATISASAPLFLDQNHNWKSE